MILRPHRKLDAAPDTSGGGGSAKGSHSDPFFTGREVRIWLMLGGLLIALAVGVLAMQERGIAKVASIVDARAPNACKVTIMAAIGAHNAAAHSHPSLVSRSKEQHVALVKLSGLLSELKGKINVLLWRSRSRGLPPRSRRAN